MSVSDNYHFHKDCAHYHKCIEKDATIGGHKVKRFWCPKLSEEMHKKTYVFKGKMLNYGDGYDKSGGSLYYSGDLHSIKFECRYFEEFQNKLTLV